MRSICLFITAFLLFYTTSFSQTFTVEGLSIYVSPHYSVSLKSGTAGDYPAATIHAFNDAVSVGSGISYRGKNYSYNDFGGQLQHYFNQIKVTAIDITIRVEGTMCDHTTSIGGSWKEGETKGNALCGVKKGSQISGSMTVNRITGTTGINALKSKIDELESAKRQEESAKKQQAAQQEDKDPWGSSNNAQKTNNGYNNSYNNPKPSNQNYSNNTQTNKAPTPNQNGYDAKGNYVGVGKFDNTPGKIYPVGPGIKRADGLYDVTDKNGKVHIISPSEQRKLEIQQRDREATQRMQAQQQQQKQMMDDFNAKMRQQQEANRIKQEQMTQLANQAVDATVQIVGFVSGLVRDAKAKKERERQRQLEAQRQEEMRLQRIAQEKAFRKESRNTALSGFKPGTIPTSTTKIDADKLYYFVYAYDPSKIEDANMIVYLSPIVEIARFGDGTWPYLRTIQEEIQPLTPFQEVFHGYYYSEEEAASAQDNLRQMLEMTKTSINSINYQRKKQGNSNSKWGNDFWSGTPVEREDDQFATDPKPKKAKDKFWDDSDVPKPAKKETIAAPAPKKDDPFWAEPVVEKKKEVVDPAPAIQTNQKKDDSFWSEETTKSKTATVDKAVLKAGADSAWMMLLDKSYAPALIRIEAIAAAEPENLSYQLILAHALLLNKQTDKAKALYTTNKKKMISALGLPWEYKVREDFVTFLSKNINEPAMDEVLILLNK